MAAKSYTCKGCGRKQDVVCVASVCTQTHNIGTDDYNDLEVGETLYLYCLECGRKLTKEQQKRLEIN